jgi:transposase-like protein
VVRSAGAYRRFQPRRARCATCRQTHILLPDQTLLRRLDAVDAIGSALTAAGAGAGYRTVARRLDVPPSTVRRWISRFTRRAFALAASGATDRVVADVDRRSIIRRAIEELISRSAGAGGEMLWRRISVITNGSFLLPLVD